MVSVTGDDVTADPLTRRPRMGPRAVDAGRLLRLGGFAALFALAGLAGRATVVDDHTLSLVWPAAGVAVLWFLVEDVRWRSADLLALAGVTYLVGMTTGLAAGAAGVFVGATVAQTLVVVHLYRRRGPGPSGEDQPLSTTSALMVLVVAAMAGCAVGAAVGVVGFWVEGNHLGLAATLAWWGRNAVGIVGVTVAGLLLLHPATRPSRTGGAALGRAWWVEAGAVAFVTALLYVAELHPVVLPVSFLLPAVLVWVGMRFSPTLTALYGLVAGACFVAVTLAGAGPFAGVESVQYAALLSQLFVAVCVVGGMVVAIYRVQMTRLLGEVHEARRASDAHAAVLGTVIASMGEGICVLDADGVVQMSNPALERTLGVPVTPGTPAREALVMRGLDGEPVTQAELPTGRALGGEVVPGVDCVADSVAGPRVVNVSATPLGEPGRPGAVVVVRDVTDERAHRRELAGFAGVVAHDLMNPIGTVDGWAEQLEDLVEDSRDPGDDVAALELAMVHKIRGAAQRMRLLVRDLLAHATSADRTLEPEPIDLAAVAAEIANERGVPRQVHIGSIPPVEGDPVLVRQLLDNLVGNAVKYVAPDEVPVIDISGDPGPGDSVRVWVADRGIGIPVGQHDVVFGDFQRAHPGYQGTGLGLAICRRIVERHGGSIAAHPRGGGGTTMELTLPAAVPAQPAGSAARTRA